MKEHKIETISDFHELVATYRAKHPIFRGVSDQSYELVSKFARAVIANEKFREINTNFKFVLNSAKEKGILYRFKNEALPYISREPLNDWEWSALAQHHGLATRFLDWTTNPLVALYFATQQDQNKNLDGAIYVIPDESKLPLANKSISPFEIEEVCRYHPSHITPRLSAQSGLFTVHYSHETSYMDDELEKWIIPQNLKIEFNGMLHTYGLNPFSMFPGLEGLCNKISLNFGL